MRLAVGEGRHEAPGDALEALAVFVVGIVVDTTHEVVLLVGHDPRAGSIAVIPDRLVAVIRGLHRAVAVVTAVGLGIAVVEAAAGIVVESVDDPVLAFRLVVDSSALGVVPAIAHSGSDEHAVDLVAVEIDGSPVGEGKVVETAHRRAAEASARSLAEVVLIAGLVVDDRDPAVSILAESILGSGVGIAACILGGRLDDADVEGLAIRLTHHLIEGTVI